MARFFDKMVIHHTAVDQPDINKMIASINRSHKERLNHPADKNWSYMAYHYLIWVDGKIVKTRDLDSIWWHASNYAVNKTSIGICLSGNLDNHPPTKAQYNSLNKLIQKFNALEIHYHHEYAPKTCPGKLFDKSKVLNINAIIMKFYEEIYKKENPDGGKLITDPRWAIERISNEDGTIDISELIYLMCIGFERIEKKL